MIEWRRGGRIPKLHAFREDRNVSACRMSTRERTEPADDAEPLERCRVCSSVLAAEISRR